MFTLSSHHKFNLFSQPTDMRKGFNGLSGIVNHILKDNPRSGEVFIFINKRRNKIKLLQWQGGGFDFARENKKVIINIDSPLFYLNRKLLT